MLGMEFSFSLANMMDPNTMVETAVMGQLFELVWDTGSDRRGARPHVAGGDDAQFLPWFRWDRR